MGKGRKSGPPNILFIICDDLGANDLACCGRQDHNTPRIDRLAGQGTRFTSAYACQAICSASRAGLLTGLNPARLHLTTFLPGRPDTVSQRLLQPEIEMGLPAGVRTLPGHFRASHVTGFIGKWHLGGERGPAGHGFDFVYHPGDSRNTTPSEIEGGKAEFELTRETLRFIGDNRDRPFLAYLAHYTPHIPYAARPELVEKNRGAFEPVYAALVETLDETVGILDDRLEALGLSENTILVFTSDNGGLHVPESRHLRVTHNTPWRAGKGYAYEGGQRVPLLVRWPGRVPAARVTSCPVSNLDWLPTLADLCGLPAPGGLDGVSIAEGLLGGDFPARPLFWHFPHYTNQGGRPSGAMRDGHWLLFEPYDGGGRELYDLARDPGQAEDLSERFPGRVREMARDLDDWRAENRVQYNIPNPRLDEAMFRSLYLDFDPSRFDPAGAGPRDWARVARWRERMALAGRLRVP